jgi:hypothetical protein
MFSSAECLAKAATARATADNLDDEGMRAHFELLGQEWLALAVTALAQEESEAAVIALQNTPGPPKRPRLV